MMAGPVDLIRDALAVRHIGTRKSRRSDRKWLRQARRHVRGAACGEHSAGFTEGCAPCTEARTAAWYAVDCPPMSGRWYREPAARLADYAERRSVT